MTTTFEDRLLTELKQEAALAAAEDRQHAPERRRLLTPARAGVGLVTAAAAAGAFIVLPGGGASPAYAVERTGNGGIDVTISDWPRGEEEVRDFAALMEENGVATIYNPPAGYMCQPLPEGEQPPPPDLPTPPGVGDGDGEDTMSHISPAGSATVIGPAVAELSVPGGGSEPEAEGGESVVQEGGLENPEDYVYHLHEGDTVILQEVETAAAITFVEGGCVPVR
ncbi:hypothetical protein [Streptomyces sp. 6N223]|uniref:hypothetical protein n=1 Tax=Streptomyces sp. 6N223 TaxID=3457412 RepID=UPI003FCFFFC9